MLDTTNTIKKGEQRIRKNDLVLVEGTGRGRFIKKGARLEVHSLQAEALIAKGAVKKISDVDPEKGKLRSRKGQ